MTNALTLSSADRLTVRSSVAPLVGEPRVSSSMTSQLVCGDVVHLVDGRGEWLRVRGLDDYEGWMHVGYLMPYAGTEHTWTISLRCTIRRDDAREYVELPIGARVPPGWSVHHGISVGPVGLPAHFPRTPAAMAETATSILVNVPYLWGGTTSWGIDCSGLTQRVYSLHGTTIPRDAWQQAEAATPLDLPIDGDFAPADLLFFSDRDDQRITHVGLAVGEGRMAHSALGRGGVRIEQLNDTEDPYVARLRGNYVGAGRVIAG